ncbi:DNRLRE domain-containing protein (plasmid) [Verrucomicrobiaceae bacterium 227]
MKLKTIITLAGLATIGATNAALTITASDATYVRSNQATTNFQDSETNVANDNGTHRIAFYTFDLSTNTGPITGVTLNVTENAGSGSDTYQIFGQADGTIDFSTMTWDSANADGHVSANRPTGTALSTFDSAGGTASYGIALDPAFFAADPDGLVTLAIVDNTPNTNGIGWTDGATLTLVPEPSSALLGSLALLGLLRRRR